MCVDALDEQLGGSISNDIDDISRLLSANERVVEVLDCIGFVGFPSNDPSMSDVMVCFVRTLHAT